MTATPTAFEMGTKDLRGDSGAVSSVDVQGRVQVATADGVVACVKAGLGIAVASQWMCRVELDPVEVHAVYPLFP